MSKMGCEPIGSSSGCCFSLTIVITGILVYILSGALVFFFIESTHDAGQPLVRPIQEEEFDLDHLRNSTVQRLWSLTVELNVFYESNWSQVAEAELEKFQEDILKYVMRSGGQLNVVRGQNGGNYCCENEASFSSFPATLLYCLTLITTIGYGTVSPRSVPGRILTVFYASVGIPLTLCYLATVGDFFSKLLRHSYSKINKRSGGGVPIPISLCFLFVYLCGGAALFWWLEGWPFVDSIFFCFASLATIGFGGMLDSHSKNISLIASSVYILVGMALISTVFNLVQDEILRGRRRTEFHSPVS